MDNQTLTPIPTYQTADISPRVLELARVIDRLPPGVYDITVAKPEVRAAAWDVTIVRQETIRTMHLTKYLPE